MHVLWCFVFCLWSDVSEYMVNICGFNLWSVSSFIFWSLEVDETVWGPPEFGGEGGACRISNSTSNSLYVVC